MKKMIGYWENVVCSKCGDKREIHRMGKTKKLSSFWCDNCHKTVKPKLV